MGKLGSISSFGSTLNGLIARVISGVGSSFGSGLTSSFFGIKSVGVILNSSFGSGEGSSRFGGSSFGSLGGSSLGGTRNAESGSTSSTVGSFAARTPDIIGGHLDVVFVVSGVGARPSAPDVIGGHLDFGVFGIGASLPGVVGEHLDVVFVDFGIGLSPPGIFGSRLGINAFAGVYDGLFVSLPVLPLVLP